MRPIDADALYNGTMKEEYFEFKAHDEDGRESFAYSCAMQRLAEAPTIAAIPVEWLWVAQGKMLISPRYSFEECAVVGQLILAWQKEQEAR